MEDSPEVNRISTSSSPSPPLQNSPFFNYLSNLSPINPYKPSHVGQAFAEFNFPPPRQIFTSPRINVKREADFLKRHQYHSSSDAGKIHVAATDVPQPYVIQSEVALIPCIAMEIEPCSPSGSVDKFLVDFLIECGTDSSDLCSKKATNLPQSLQCECSSPNDPLAGNGKVGKDEEAASNVISSEQSEEQVGEKSFPHVEMVGTEGHFEKNNDEGPPNELQDLVSKNVNGLTEPYLYVESSSSKRDDPHFLDQTINDFTSLSSSGKECGFAESEKGMPVGSSDIDHRGTEDIKMHPAEGGQLREWDCTPQMLPESFLNDQVDDIDYENYGAMSHRTIENQMPYDFKESAQKKRGMRRRCLQFEASHALSKNIGSSSSWNLTDVAPNASSLASPMDSEILNASNAASNKISSNSQVVTFSRNTSSRLSVCPFKTPENHIDTVERPARNSGSSTVTAPTPSGIGLHLNRIGSALMVSCNLNGQLTAKDYLNVKGEKSLSDSNCHISKDPNGRLVHCSLVGNLSAKLTAYPEDHTNIEVEQQKSRTSIVPNSFTSLLTSSLKVDPLKNSLQFNHIQQHATPREKKRGAPEYVSCSEFNQMSDGKKRKKEAHSIEDEGCKRCKCKKSKCLKLYCDCFAAGVYCAEICSCQECFNKPEYEDTVLEARQLIESRNPLAFAPKIVQCITKSPQKSDENGNRTTPASSRHKRGCNCKKSECLKKYCECYQVGVGCSVGCRCEGCKNVFGKKRECSKLAEMEHITAKDEQYEEFSYVKQDRAYVKSPTLHQQCHSDQLTLLTPLLQCSNYGRDAPNSQNHSKIHLTSSPESETSVSLSHGESSKYPRNSNSNNRLVKKVKQNAFLATRGQELDCQTGIADQFSPSGYDLANICNISPLPQLSQSRITISEISDTRYCLKASNPQSCHKNGEAVGSLHWRSSITPTCCGGSQFVADPDSGSWLKNLHEDEIPDILSETLSPIKAVKASSPNQKRVSPPQNCLRELRRSSSSLGLRSGR